MACAPPQAAGSSGASGRSVRSTRRAGRAHQPAARAAPTTPQATITPAVSREEVRPKSRTRSRRRTSSGPRGTPRPTATTASRAPRAGTTTAARTAPTQGAPSSSPTRRASSTGCRARSDWRPATAAAMAVARVEAATAARPAATAQRQPRRPSSSGGPVTLAAPGRPFGVPRTPPGSARVGGAGEQPRQQRLLGVEAVLGLVEHGRVGAVHDLSGDLLAPVGGQAVQHHGVRGGGHHRVGGQRVGLEDQGPLAVLHLLAHRRPDVGVEHVGVLGGGGRVVGQLDAAAGGGGDLGGPPDHLGDGLVAERGGHGHVHAHLGPGEQQAVGDVVAVAQVGEADALEPALALADGLEVGQGLAGVGVVGEGVDHRDGPAPGQPLQALLGEGAQHDGVHVAGQDGRGVLQGLAPAELELGPGQGQGVAAELVHGDLEGDPGPGGGLLEDEGDRAAAQGVAGAPVGLVAVGPVQQGDQLAGVDVVDRQEVSFAHGRSPVAFPLARVLTRVARVVMSKGFSSTASGPSSLRSGAMTSAAPVTTRTANGREPSGRRRLRMTSGPPSPGIITSSSTTSGSTVRASSRPSSPSAARMTSRASSSRIVWSSPRTLGSSSTTSTRLDGMWSLSGLPSWPVRARPGRTVYPPWRPRASGGRSVVVTVAAAGPMPRSTARSTWDLAATAAAARSSWEAERPSATTVTGPKLTPTLPGCSATPAVARASSTAGQEGKPAARAARRATDPAIALAAARASVWSAAPWTVTTTSLRAPGTRRARPSARDSHSWVRAASKAAAPSLPARRVGAAAVALASSTAASAIPGAWSTMTRSKERATARPSRPSSTPASTVASVVSSTSVVADGESGGGSGGRTPRPPVGRSWSKAGANGTEALAAPPMRTSPSDQATATACSRATPPVVLMALATSPEPRRPRAAVALSAASAASATARRTPMAPVPQSSTSPAGQPMAAAQRAARAAASASPSGPVAALALPAWTSTARARPVRSWARDQRTGAEANGWLVKRPAAIEVCWLTTSPRSGPGPGASPASTAEARNPRGAHSPPSTPATV